MPANEPQDGGLSLNPFKKSLPDDPRIQELVTTYDVENNYIFPKYEILEAVINPKSVQFSDVFTKLYNDTLHELFKRPEFYQKDGTTIKGEKDDKAIKPVFKDEVQKPVMDLAVKEYIRFIYHNVMIRLSRTDQFKQAYTAAGGDMAKLKEVLENVPAMREFLTPDVRKILDNFRHKRENTIKTDKLDSEDAKTQLNDLVAMLKDAIANLPPPTADAPASDTPQGEAKKDEGKKPEETPPAAPTGGGKVYIQFISPSNRHQTRGRKPKQRHRKTKTRRQRYRQPY